LETKGNLLFIMRSMGGGGAERVTLDLLHYLDSNRYSVTLAVLWDQGMLWQDVPEWVTVIPVLKEGTRLRRGLPSILATLLRHAWRADAILGTMELEATYVAFTLALLTRKPCIGWVHTNLDHYLTKGQILHRMLVKCCYPRVLRIVGPSHGCLEALCRIAPMKQNRLMVIHNLLNVPVVAAKSAESLPEEFTKYFTKPTVLGVGNLYPQKGFDLLIKAHAALMQKGQDHNLVIIGEGPSRSELEDLVKDLNVADSVFLPGFQRNPYPWFKKAKVFALSSRFEGFAIVVAEALALGIPIVATDCPSGPGEILDHGRYGVLVPPEDVSELAKGISRILSDPKLCAELSLAGQKRAAEFAGKSIVPKWESLFQEVIR
jgi:glycosyltransferase involved in cell wall biosynthesis